MLKRPLELPDQMDGNFWRNLQWKESSYFP
jgi:hypothetical protein